MENTDAKQWNIQLSVTRVYTYHLDTLFIIIYHYHLSLFNTGDRNDDVENMIGVSVSHLYLETLCHIIV